MAAAPELEAAERRGFQRGIREAGELWVALFFGFAGTMAGWIARMIWERYAG